MSTWLVSLLELAYAFGAGITSRLSWARNARLQPSARWFVTLFAAAIWPLLVIGAGYALLMRFLATPRRGPEEHR